MGAVLQADVVVEGALSRQIFSPAGQGLDHDIATRRAPWAQELVSINLTYGTPQNARVANALSRIADSLARPDRLLLVEVARHADPLG